MVKYVENKFDEDYIQTLGTLLSCDIARFISFMRPVAL